MTLSFLHVPKTGGSARRAALRGELDRGRVLYQHHERNAKVAPGTLVLYTRDPLTRFVSGFDAFRSVIEGTMSGQGLEIRDINDFVENYHWCMRDCGETNRLVFRPQTWWDDPEKDDIIRLQVESMDTSFPQLLKAYGLDGKLPARDDPASNTYAITKLPKSVLNDASIQFVREFYTDDFLLWESARGETIAQI